MLSFFLYSAVDPPDTQGRDFIFPIMDNDGSSNNLNLYITTKRQSDVSVRLTGNQVNSVFTTTSGTVVHQSISRSSVCSGTCRSQNSIRVLATQEIMVTGDVVAIPVSTLGTEYYGVTFSDASTYGQLAVVATDDDTSVSFTFPSDATGLAVTYDGVTYGPGDTLTVTLNNMETFKVVSEDADLTGTFIESTVPISLLSGNRDTIMLPSKSAWGKYFVTTPVPNVNVDVKYRIVSHDVDTQVSVTCDGVTTNHSPGGNGGWVEVTMSSTHPCVVQSNRGIMIVQFQTLNMQTDPSMQVILRLLLY